MADTQYRLMYLEANSPGLCESSDTATYSDYIISNTAIFNEGKQGKDYGAVRESIRSIKSHQKHREESSWLTALVNDNFVIPSIVLGWTLQKYSCVRSRLVLATEGVSPQGIEALRKAGFSVRMVPPLDCNYMDRKKGRKESGRGIIGTHTRFHAWNYTQFQTMVYVDSDYMPLHNMDEVFYVFGAHKKRRTGGGKMKRDGGERRGHEIEMDDEGAGDFSSAVSSQDEGYIAATYCSRPGVAEPCFNAGILAFQPSTYGYEKIMETWSSLSDYGQCPNDQVLLWHLFADRGRWRPLPYSYNVRRMMYYPMKAYHFACCKYPKPWLMQRRPSWEEVLGAEGEKGKKDGVGGPLLEVEDILMLWWRRFYLAIDEFGLQRWWEQEAKKIDKRMEKSKSKEE
eukprot:Nk52_evm15s221 gene=Nk52_evmTU15s221